MKTDYLTNIEEFDLTAFVVDVVASKWKTIVCIAVLATSVMAAYLISMPPSYEAISKIQVARVIGADVEPPATAIERINSPIFLNNEIVSMCADSSKRMGKIHATAVHTASYIELRYKASSPAIAKACLQALVSQLNTAEKPLMDGLLKGPKQRLLIYQGQLKDSLTLLNKIDIAAINFNSSDSRFSQSALLLSAYLTKKSETEGLRREIAELESSMQPPKTNDVSLFEVIYAPTTPIGLPTVAKLMISLFLGLMIAFCVAVISRLVGHRPPQPANPTSAPSAISNAGSR